MKTTQAFRKINVLAVDDIAGNLVALEAVLSEDCNLVTAPSGPQALAILDKRQDFDVILMDLQMPVMDGFETASRIKKLPGCDDIPIIFITAHYKEDPFVKRGYEVGAVDYFSKPFDPDILKLKVSIYASFRQKAEVLKERELQIQATEELIRTGRRLSAVLENLPVGVLISDVSGRICQINEEVSRICSAPTPLDHESYADILGWWDAQGQKLKEKNGPLGRALTGTSTHGEVVQINCFNGGQKMILTSASPLLGDQKKIVGAVVIIQDVTESKKIGIALEERITNLVSIGYNLEHYAKL